jgi:hypothetical protein
MAIVLIQMLDSYWREPRFLLRLNRKMSRMPKGAYKLGGLVVVLVAVVAFLPTIRNIFAPVFPEGFQSAGAGAGAGAGAASGGATTQSRPLTCQGVVCKEGEFCADNTCRPRYVPAGRDPMGFATGISAVVNYMPGAYGRKVDCLGVICGEGEFCEDNTCKPRYLGASGEPEGYLS